MEEGGAVRTPMAMRQYGPRTGFHSSQISTCPVPGDVSSPAAWVAVFDILLRSLEATLSFPYGVRGHGDVM